MAAETLFNWRVPFIGSVNGSIIKDIIDDLLQQEVLSYSEEEAIKEGETTTKDKARLLIDIVRKKGDNASEKFIKCLQSRDSTLYHKLCKSEPPPSPPAASSSAPQKQKRRSPECDQWIIPCSLEFYQQKQNAESDQIYPIMDKINRQRTALIINNIRFAKQSERHGADVDENEMKKLLRGLDYEVEVRNDLDAKEMKEALKNFAGKQDSQKTDSTFIVIMSHGVRDAICGVKSDGKKNDLLEVDTIFREFNATNCPALRNKPKVILIQACRGANKGYAEVSDSAVPGDANSDSASDYEDDALKKVHIESDFICFYSSTPDNVSRRNPKTGSRFIQKLIEVVRTEACEHHIEELFRRVQQSFQDFPRQMPTKERTTLIKNFYLFPGF